jgi:hypothetical protein
MRSQKISQGQGRLQAHIAGAKIQCAGLWRGVRDMCNSHGWPPFHIAGRFRHRKSFGAWIVVD